VTTCRSRIHALQNKPKRNFADGNVSSLAASKAVIAATKVRAQVARVHRTITNTRNSWLHKKSAGLVKRADLIIVEDLKVANMIRHPTLARSIADASWSRFCLDAQLQS